MRKEDMVRFHALLFQVRRDLEQHQRVESDAFQAYDAFGVEPTHLHRDLRAHRMACFLLGEAISRAVAQKHPLRFIQQPARGL